MLMWYFRVWCIRVTHTGGTSVCRCCAAGCACVRRVHRLCFLFRRVQWPRAVIYVRLLEGLRVIVTFPTHLTMNVFLQV